MDDDIRDIINQTVDEQNKTNANEPTPGSDPVAGTPAPSPGTTAPVVDAPAGTPAAPAPPAGTPAAPAPPAGTPSPEATGDDKAKHNLGTVIAGKAPGTWSPQAREHWGTLPPQVQAEVAKRESEISRALTQSTQARQFHREFQHVVQPHLAFFAADGVHPLQGVQQVMQQAAVLRVGSSEQKAGLLVNLIKHFGVDIDMLDQMLAGQQPQGGQQRAPAQTDIQALIRQELAPLLNERQSQNQALMAEVESTVDNEINAFREKHEFYDDVRHEMADMMEVARRRGVNMGLTEAYERATLLVPSVRETLDQRKKTEALQATHKAAQQAKSGAFSIQNSANASVTAPVGDDGDSVRSAVMASIAQHQGR